VLRREIRLRLPRLAGKNTAPEQQPGIPTPVQCAIAREVGGFGKLQLLVDAAERTCLAFIARRIPFGEVEARSDAHVPRQAGVGDTGESQSAFAPRGRDDRRLDEIAGDAEILRRLVRGVE